MYAPKIAFCVINVPAGLWTPAAGMNMKVTQFQDSHNNFEWIEMGSICYGDRWIWYARGDSSEGLDEWKGKSVEQRNNIWSKM